MLLKSETVKQSLMIHYLIPYSWKPIFQNFKSEIITIFKIIIHIKLMCHAIVIFDQVIVINSKFKLECFQTIPNS